MWLEIGKMRKETEGLLIAAQDQALKIIIIIIVMIILTIIIIVIIII